jgi:amino acid transporter
MKNEQKIGWLTATSLVVSNMIGTGVFTSLGFQLNAVQNTWSILLLWSIGGVLALIGAFTFAELGTHYKETGGDYIFISKGIHPLLGYLSAWSSLIVGFAGPVAIAAIAMEAYMQPFNVPYPRWISTALIVGISWIHSFSVRQSGRFQDATTLFKVFFVLLLILGGIFLANPDDSNQALRWDGSFRQELFTPGFAVSLLYVTYAYTGWNAAAYIVGEIDTPRSNLPKALIAGTLMVTVCYLLVQLAMLRSAPLAALQGQEEVTKIAADYAFGSKWGRWISIGIALQLIGTMSSYIWIGPRVVQTMAKSYRLWQPLSVNNSMGVPVRGVWLQCAITLGLIFSGSLQQVLLYTSFLLQLMGTVAVASLLFTQRQATDFHSPMRPWIQIFYLLLSTGALVYIAFQQPYESAVSLLILGVGVLTYFWNKQLK